jgi:nitrogen fixation NifU-like protein
VNKALSDLYRDVILDHSKRPRNQRRLEGRVAVAEEYNPLCGDRVTVYVELADGVVRDATFQGEGCALSTASASVMTEVVRGRALREVAELCEAFAGLVTAAIPLPATIPNVLTAFVGVRAFPSRVKCTLLPWQALRAALRPD